MAPSQPAAVFLPVLYNLRARGKGRKLAWQCDGHETQKVAQRRSILGSPGERGRERVVK